MAEALATLAAEVRHLLEVKKSRFLAQAAPAADVEQAQAFLARVADAQATHNCWAWRIGANYRSSDDGEPSGTAGRPILAALDGQGLDQVVVVVTRWYGGIKLGAGGLVRAYGGTTAECLRTAPRRALVAWQALTVRCEFAHEAVVRALVADHGGHADATRYDRHGAELALQLPAGCVDAFALRLQDASRGQAMLASQPAAAHPGAPGH